MDAAGGRRGTRPVSALSAPPLHAPWRLGVLIVAGDDPGAAGRGRAGTLRGEGGEEGGGGEGVGVTRQQPGSGPQPELELWKNAEHGGPGLPCRGGKRCSTAAELPGRARRAAPRSRRPPAAAGRRARAAALRRSSSSAPTTTTRAYSRTRTSGRTCRSGHVGVGGHEGARGSSALEAHPLPGASPGSRRRAPGSGPQPSRSSSSAPTTTTWLPPRAPGPARRGAARRGAGGGAGWGGAGQRAEAPPPARRVAPAGVGWGAGLTRECGGVWMEPSPKSVGRFHQVRGLWGAGPGASRWRMGAREGPARGTQDGDSGDAAPLPR